MLSAKQGGIKYHFFVLGMPRPGIEPQFPVPLANTLFINHDQVQFSLWIVQQNKGVQRA